MNEVAVEELYASLRRVVVAGQEIVRARRENGANGDTLGAFAFAQILADTADARWATEQAALIAAANDYARGSRARFEEGETTAGRRLDASAIHDTGFGAAILAGEEVGDNTIAELAAYLAGPAVDIFRLIGIDADIFLSTPLAVDDWELFVASEDDLRHMLPVPSLVAFQPRRPWDPELWRGVAFFRQAVDVPPVVGHVFSIPEAYPEWKVWRPLLVLALVSPDVVTMWSDHRVEPGRHVATQLDRVYYDMHGGWYDNDEVYEVPHRGTVNIEPPEELAFRTRMEKVASLLPPVPATATTEKQKKKQMPYIRLKLAAQRLLAAGEHAAGHPTPFDPVHSTEAMLHYVVALEALLGEDTRDGEISRKISQRTAVLVGRDDAERLTVGKAIRDIYGVRSTVLHGGSEPSMHDVDELRGIVRRVILARLVLSDPPVGYASLINRCDEALLSIGSLANLRDALQPFDDIVLLGAGKDVPWERRHADALRAQMEDPGTTDK